MDLKDRAYGIEIEYGCLLEREGKIIPREAWPYEYLRSHIFSHADRSSSVFSDYARVRHQNGSLTYIDTGAHPEHSSAETRRVKDALIYTFAGDRMMRDLFSMRGSQGISGLLFRNNIADDDSEMVASFGCHENYLGHYRNTDTEMFYNHPSFKPFLATRQIFDGTGYWGGNEAFFLSQRTAFYNYASRIKQNRDKQELSVRVKDGNAMPRIHLIYGDSTMLDVATFLKIGTTSLVLSLLEAGKLPSVTCKNAYMDMLNVARVNPWEKVVCTDSHGMMSACEVQRLYCQTARAYLADVYYESEKSAAEAEMIMDLWDQALHAFEMHDIGWGLGRIDWITKQWIVQREIMRARATGSPMSALQIRSDLNVLYHAICGSAMRERIHAQWPRRRIVSDEEIAHAMLNPPMGTRASARGAIIRMAIKRYAQDYLTVDWHGISAQNRKGFFRFLMPDPLNTYEEGYAWGEETLIGGGVPRVWSQYPNPGDFS